MRVNLRGQGGKYGCSIYGGKFGSRLALGRAAWSLWRAVRNLRVHLARHYVGGTRPCVGGVRDCGRRDGADSGVYDARGRQTHGFTGSRRHPRYCRRRRDFPLAGNDGVSAATIHRVLGGANGGLPDRCGNTPSKAYRTRVAACALWRSIDTLRRAADVSTTCGGGAGGSLVDRRLRHRLWNPVDSSGLPSERVGSANCAGRSAGGGAPLVIFKRQAAIQSEKNKKLATGPKRALA